MEWNLKLRKVNLETSLEERSDCLKACNRHESLFSVALKSFQSSFGYKVKLVSKLQEIFDNFKYLTDKNEKQLFTR